MASRCTVLSRARHRRTCSLSRAASTSSLTWSGYVTAAVRRSRVAAAVTDRTRSMARRRATVSTHAVGPPLPGS